MRSLATRLLAVLLPLLLAQVPHAARPVALVQLRALAANAAAMTGAEAPARAAHVASAAMPAGCSRECCKHGDADCCCKRHRARAAMPDCGCGTWHRGPAPAAPLRDGGSALIGVLAPAVATLAPPALCEKTPRLDVRAHLRWGTAPEPPPDDARG